MAVAISAMMGLGRERLLARRKRGLRVRLCLCVCLFVCVSVCVLSRHESSQYGFRSRKVPEVPRPSCAYFRPRPTCVCVPCGHPSGTGALIDIRSEIRYSVR